MLLCRMILQIDSKGETINGGEWYKKRQSDANDGALTKDSTVIKDAAFTEERKHFCSFLERERVAFGKEEVYDDTCLFGRLLLH